MTQVEYLTALNNAKIRFELLGCWYMVQVINRMILEVRDEATL